MVSTSPSSERGEVELLTSLDLPSIARGAVAGQLGDRPSAVPDVGPRAASFVTIFSGRELRGCIGNTTVRWPVTRDVAEHARAAAFRDPRFPPVQTDELADLRFEVSVLSVPRPVVVTSYRHALTCARPQLDGVAVRSGTRRGLFLPQVWRQLPEPSDFFAALWNKAGLVPGVWSSDMALELFSVHKFVED